MLKDTKFIVKQKQLKIILSFCVVFYDGEGGFVKQMFCLMKEVEIIQI